MRSINKIFLIGNVTREPEIKKTLSGESIATFGLATNRDWQTRDGKREHSAEFHEIVCWSGLAERAARLVKKGMFLNIQGYLKTRSWDAPDGLKKFRTEIVAENLIILEKFPLPEKLQSEDSSEKHPEDAMPTDSQPSIEIENPSTL